MWDLISVHFKVKESAFSDRVHPLRSKLDSILQKAFVRFFLNSEAYCKIPRFYLE